MQYHVLQLLMVANATFVQCNQANKQKQNNVGGILQKKHKKTQIKVIFEG